MPWSKKDERYIEVKTLELDIFEHTDDLDHDYGIYTLNMRKRCSKWLENEDPIIAANALLISIRKACSLITGQMHRIANDFIENGGFTEKMSKARLEYRDAEFEAEGSPKCPVCGKSMRKVVARKGRYIGKSFWGCSDYPNCNGTRDI